MTEQQRAGLESLNAQIAQTCAETRLQFVDERAQLLSQTDCDLRQIAPDCGAWIRGYYQREEWKNLPAWEVRAQLLYNAHSQWNAATKAQRSNESARLNKAYAMARFAYLVEISPKLRDARDFDALDVLENAHKGDETPDERENASLEELQLWTLARHITHGVEAAALIHERILRRQIAAGRYSSATSSHVRRARRLQSEPYRQLAWWNLVVAHAPDEPKWWAERARCCNKPGRVSGGNWRDATRDLGRAIALAPDDPRAYEALAKVHSPDNWWDLSPDSRGDAANYVRAITLRIESGQINGTSAALCAQGDRQLQRVTGTNWVSPDYNFARAYAFYTLALAADPTDATPYLKRAATLEALPLKRILNFATGQSRESWAACENYLRALKLDALLEVAPAGVVAHLTRELRQTTAHERIESLLRERQRLRDFDIKSSLASAIVAEVERALAV